MSTTRERGTARAPRSAPVRHAVSAAAPAQAGPARRPAAPTTRERLAAQLHTGWAPEGVALPETAPEALQEPLREPGDEPRREMKVAHRPSPDRCRPRGALGAGDRPGERRTPARHEPGVRRAARGPSALAPPRPAGPRDPRPTGPGRGPGAARAPPRLLTRLQVTSPADPWEVEAEAVAALVRGGHARPGPAGAGAQTTPGDAKGCGDACGAGLPTGAGTRWHRELDDARAERVAAALAPSGTGSALPRALRDRIEPVLGADLSGVRVRHDEASGGAARALGARAFTVGRTIHLAPSSSIADVGLIAHEATHVVQQGLASPRAPPVVMRDVSDYLPDIDIGDVIPDWIIDGVRSSVRAIPGYTALTYVVGEDLLTGERVSVDFEALIDAVLTYGPFGSAVGAVLRGLSIVQEIYQAVVARFTAHDLTLSRIGRDLESAWDEVSISKGIDGNVAVLRRYVTAFLRDLVALVDDLIELVLTLVREAVISVAEPLLATPAVAPVWNLVKEVLHYDPLRGVEVQVPTAQIIADFLTLIGQEERLEQMRERGTLQETADWLDLQMGTFLSIATDLSTLFSDAWAAIQPRNLPDLIDTLPGLADRAIGLVGRIVDFGTTLIAQVLELIKNALLGWLSEHAHEVPGFHLLTVIIRRNPFTDEAVPRTARNLIRGFITLMPGGEATFDELSEAGVIGDAADRIEGAMARLGISWEMVVATFTGIWDSLSLDDLLQPVAAFGRVVAQFGAPVARIVEFVAVVLEVVVTLILRLMNFPSELLGSVVSNAMAAMADIRRDPVGFLVNMLAALKLGFSNFFANIGGYLLDGLVAWLFRGLGQAGITLPSDLSFGSILGLVLDVLGLSVDYLWAKLGEHVGEERVAQMRGALDTLGEAWQFLGDVQREGLPAIWRFLSDQLSNLWQTLLDAALEWITRVVVTRATARLLSMLDPTGVMAVINSAVAIFDAIQSAIEYLRDLLEVLNTYVSTLAAIAAGNVQPGAQMLEQGLAAIIPIAIGFLANQVGLGNMPEKIVELIGSLRELVDRAVDWLIQQALRLGRAALAALGVGGGSDEEEAGAEPDGLEVREPLRMDDTSHTLTVVVVGDRPQVEMASVRAENLRTMVLAAMAREGRGANRAQVLSWLGQIEGKLEDLYYEWRAAHSKSDAEKRATIVGWLHGIAAALQDFGREFGIDDLEHLGHASRYVEGNQLKPPYDTDIRRWFYPSGYLTATQDWKRDQLDQLRHPTNAALFLDQSSGTYEPVADVTIDHQPRVVEHWNSTGRNRPHGERSVYYNDVSEANLQLVARRHNSADGALARALGHLYRPEVGPEFTGPDDESA